MIKNGLYFFQNDDIIFEFDHACNFGATTHDWFAIYPAGSLNSDGSLPIGALMWMNGK